MNSTMSGHLFAYSPSDVDKVLLDPWSGIHAGTGIVLGILGFNIEQVLFIATTWEFVENSPLGKLLWTIVGDDHYEGDTLVNIITDIFFVTYFSKANKYFGDKVSILLLCTCFIYFQSYTFHLREEPPIIEKNVCV